jgi:hypothetical protein
VDRFVGGSIILSILRSLTTGNMDSIKLLLLRILIGEGLGLSKGVALGLFNL